MSCCNKSKCTGCLDASIPRRYMVYPGEVTERLDIFSLMDKEFELNKLKYLYYFFYFYFSVFSLILFSEILSFFIRKTISLSLTEFNSTIQRKYSQLKKRSCNSLFINNNQMNQNTFSYILP